MREANKQRAALRLFHRSIRPLPVGAVAMELGLRIDQTEQILSALLDDRLIRRATPEECKSCDLVEGFALVGEPSAAMAGDDI